MPTISLTYFKSHDAIDAYVSFNGTGPIVKDIRRKDFAVGLTAKGNVKSCRIVNMQNQGGTFAEIARSVTNLGVLTDRMKQRLFASANAEANRIVKDWQKRSR